MSETQRPFKILCIDGGGIKGLYSAQVLSKLEKHFNTLLCENFDLICGTSTGGIIALAASLGISMNKTVEMYESHGPLIFDEKRKRINLYRKFLKIRQTLFWSKYSVKPLREALESVFKDKCIGDAKTLLCIPSINVITGIPRVFKRDYSANGKFFSEDNNKKCIDVALATSAAPTYFPAHEIDGDIFIDGGLWANNPILTGLTEYCYQFATDERFSSVDILSISSCEKSIGISIKRKNRGFYLWSDTLFDNYSVGLSHSLLFFVEKLKAAFHKKISIERVVNRPLSCDQHKLIELDNASEQALSLLKSLGSDAAANAQVKDSIISFFNKQKTIYLS